MPGSAIPQRDPRDSRVWDSTSRLARRSVVSDRIDRTPLLRLPRLAQLFLGPRLVKHHAKADGIGTLEHGRGGRAARIAVDAVRRPNSSAFILTGINSCAVVLRQAFSMNVTANLRSLVLCVLCRLALVAAPALLSAQVPEWIWHDAAGATPEAGEVRCFRKTFNAPAKTQRAEIIAAGDDEVTVFLNGKEVVHGTDWRRPVKADVSHLLRDGPNVLAARGKNGEAGAAAILVRLEYRTENNFGVYVTSDKSWLSSAAETAGWETLEFAAKDWKPAVSLGTVGVAPWGNVLGKPTATPAEAITALPGFKVELLKSADEGEGSWICLTVDDQGRLIISPEKDQAPLLRLTLTPQGQVAKTETIPAPVRAAMGLLYAHESLYLNGHGPKGVGLYRLIDANKNDQFDPGEVHLLKNFEGDNEHGYHAVVLGPDGMIYVMNGNHTKVPDGLAPDSPYENYAEDLLLPRLWDANGHAKGVLAPGGYVVRTDPEGKRWELLYGGFRNTYDFDFSPDGEMFTYDSDMEWDIGCPWYRPTRVLHCVIGGEYGWRSGTGKWPAYYPDSLPSVVDIGLGSPCGVKFGTKSHFPEKYRRAFFIQDWNYGKIFAVHLTPNGASYTGEFETFLSGKPLAVVDLEFGRDGAMYFIIGGWKIQSGLYRVSYAPMPVGTRSTASQHSTKRKGGDAVERVPTSAEETDAAEARALRRKLESFHGRKDPAAIDLAWPHLDSPDRWLRFAARVAVESQDVPLWQDRALAEERTNGSLTALLALARKGQSNLQVDLLQSLCRLAGRSLTEAQTLEALRVLQLCFIRMGRPDYEVATAVARELSGFYPALTENVNRELCQLLVYLDAPDAITKTLALLSAAPTQQEQMHYACILRNAKTGWTLDQRRAYFSWFNKALREYTGGNSFKPYLVNIRNDAVATLKDAERAELAAILEDRKPAAIPPLAPRPLVKEWKFEDLEPALADATRGRSFAKGKEAFHAAQCLHCHRLAGEGGAVGPDLTGVSGRFNRRDLLDHILNPSKIISDRYQSYTITLRNGDDVSGYIVDESDGKLTVLTDPLADRRTVVFQKDIASRDVANLSVMPEGLLNLLTQGEILDLLAYLEADGRPDHAVFTAGR
jgi:putative heme-binding domain-containing protein